MIIFQKEKTEEAGWGWFRYYHGLGFVAGGYGVDQKEAHFMVD